jgi:hypothetical protein
MTQEKSQIDDRIKKRILQPLREEKGFSPSNASIYDSINRLENIAYLDCVAQEIRDEIYNQEKFIPKDIDALQNQVSLIVALYHAHRISLSEYIFYAYSLVNDFHENRWFEGYYDEDLKETKEAIQKIEQDHGLLPDEYWPRKKGPKDWMKLNDIYEKILERRMLELLQEFNLNDLVEMHNKNKRKSFYSYERGRRTVFHKNEQQDALKDLIVYYESEARISGASGAYSAAIISLGSALEGLLLLRCLQSQDKAIRIASALPTPPKDNNITRWRFETLIETCLAAGWLPTIQTENMDFKADALANILRDMRNNAHPGRILRSNPWVRVEQRDYHRAEDIYIALSAHILKESGDLAT